MFFDACLPFHRSLHIDCDFSFGCGSLTLGSLVLSYFLWGEVNTIFWAQEPIFWPETQTDTGCRFEGPTGPDFKLLGHFIASMHLATKTEYEVARPPPTQLKLHYFPAEFARPCKVCGSLAKAHFNDVWKTSQHPR